MREKKEKREQFCFARERIFLKFWLDIIYMR
jgi:hypothetical protein